MKKNKLIHVLLKNDLLTLKLIYVHSQELEVASQMTGVTDHTILKSLMPYYTTERYS